MKIATAALVVLVLLAAGCSSRGPEEQLRAAWKASGEALKTRDSDAICDMLSDKARRYVLNRVHRSAIPGVNSCQTLWAKIFARFGEKEQQMLRTSKLLKINIDGDHATTLDSTQGNAPTAWIRQDGQWRIDDVGF